MENNVLKISAVSAAVVLGAPEENALTVIAEAKAAAQHGVDILLFSELFLCGATAGDLYFQPSFLVRAEKAFAEVVEATKTFGTLIAIGYPMRKEGEIFDISALVGGGKVLLRAERKHLDGVGFGDMRRWFVCSDQENGVFSVKNVTVEIAFFRDVVAPNYAPRQGTQLLLVPSALLETDRKEEYLEKTFCALSERGGVAVAFANAGEGESTTDELYAGGCYVVNKGKIVASSPSYSDNPADAEIVFAAPPNCSALRLSDIGENLKFSPRFPFFCEDAENEKLPFISTNYVAQATKIFIIQAEALKRRLLHVGAEKAVIGVSGGLDSTLALLVCVEAVRRAGKGADAVLAVTMPGGGTSGRTYENAKTLMRLLGVDMREISIKDAFQQHLKDLRHDGTADVAYENAQARERTQILMDLANMTRGIVVGTGDLSELAMGFCTYNGDHMAMYGVNASIPKTLMRSVVTGLAERHGGELGLVLKDIVETPVSPELKPSEKGEISQFSESVVGPYELVDFFLYRFYVKSENTETVRFRAKSIFGSIFSDAELEKWLHNFQRRFFTAQFKRSCLPDGVNATGVSLSPRGGLLLASDLSEKVFDF